MDVQNLEVSKNLEKFLKKTSIRALDRSDGLWRTAVLMEDLAFMSGVYKAELQWILRS